MITKAALWLWLQIFIIFPPTDIETKMSHFILQASILVWKTVAWEREINSSITKKFLALVSSLKMDGQTQNKFLARLSSKPYHMTTFIRACTFIEDNFRHNIIVDLQFTDPQLSFDITVVALSSSTRRHKELDCWLQLIC